MIDTAQMGSQYTELQAQEMVADLRLLGYDVGYSILAENLNVECPVPYDVWKKELERR